MKERLTYLTLFMLVACIGWGSVYWAWLNVIPAGLLWGFRLGSICILLRVLAKVFPTDGSYDVKEDDEDASIRQEQHILHVGPFADQPPV